MSRNTGAKKKKMILCRKAAILFMIKFVSVLYLFFYSCSEIKFYRSFIEPRNRNKLLNLVSNISHHLKMNLQEEDINQSISVYFWRKNLGSEPEFVNLLRSPGFDNSIPNSSLPGRYDNPICKATYAGGIGTLPWNRFLGSLNVYEFRLLTDQL